MAREDGVFGGQSGDGWAVSRLVACIAWPVVLVAAILVHNVTGSPIVAASLLAIHAGWRTFRCGLWLRRVDPVAARGWACFWFYLAAAFWKAAVGALATFFILFAIEDFTGQPPSEKEVMVEGLVMACGICLSSTIGIIAVASALRGGVRAWVHPNVREKCHGDFARLARIGVSPPGILRRFYRTFNEGACVVLVSLLSPAAAVATGVLIWITIDRPCGAAPNLVADFLPLWGALIMLPVYKLLAPRVVARRPAECWPTNV